MKILSQDIVLAEIRNADLYTINRLSLFWKKKNRAGLWYYLAVRALVCLCKKLNSVALVREQTMPTERPPLVGEVIANFGG
jgi:hypothetical protein